MIIFSEDKTSHKTVKSKVAFGVSAVQEGSTISIFATHQTPLSSVWNANLEDSIWGIR